MTPCDSRHHLARAPTGGSVAYTAQLSRVKGQLESVRRSSLRQTLRRRYGEQPEAVVAVRKEPVSRIQPNTYEENPVVRKIINFTHATLDGYIDRPHEWERSNEELQDYVLEMHLDADALLLGRITYEGMARAWPTRSGDPFSDHVNTITKYVVASEPVDTTGWEPTAVIAGPNLLDEVSHLKQAEGGDIVIWGTGQLTDALAEAGLLDEYRICTHPVIKGGGEPLFRPASAGTVELLDTKIVVTGAVVHTYRPVPAP